MFHGFHMLKCGQHIFLEVCERWCCYLHDKSPTTLVSVSESECRQWIYSWWSSGAFYWSPLSPPHLACISIETAFLFDFLTAKPHHWSKGPQVWACSWTNQNLMCLLRDPAFHQCLFHHSGQMDGLLEWRMSDTWHPHMRQETLSEGNRSTEIDLNMTFIATLPILKHCNCTDLLCRNRC